MKKVGAKGKWQPSELIRPLIHRAKRGLVYGKDATLQALSTPDEGSPFFDMFATDTEPIKTPPESPTLSTSVSPTSESFSSRITAWDRTPQELLTNDFTDLRDTQGLPQEDANRLQLLASGLDGSLSSTIRTMFEFISNDEPVEASEWYNRPMKEFVRFYMTSVWV